MVIPPPEGVDPLLGTAIVPSKPPANAVQAQPAQLPTIALEPSPADPEVKQTAIDESALKLKTPRPKDLPYASLRAAAVGEEIITFNELDRAVNDQITDMLGSQLNQIGEAEYNQIRVQVTWSVLNRLIDQALILQEAKHKLEKNPKAIKQFDETLDKV